MDYGKKKAKQIKTTEKDMEEKLHQLLIEQDQTDNMVKEAEIENKILEVKTKLEEIYDYKTKGLMLRSQVSWFEKGTKYFLQLESRNKMKKYVNKLQKVDGGMSTDATEILEMQAQFY